MNREGITLLHIVPAVAYAWLDSVRPGTTLKSLRYVFFAGESLRDSLLRKWRDAFPDSGQAVNLYGATETTLAKCFYELPTAIMPGVQPVGRPLPETQALVLSKDGKLCGIGEIGQIVLRTPFRTLGYINDPREQQQHFKRNPFRDDPNDVVYYTGDLGRYRIDGLLSICGRLDDQVKIRGVRVEPDEVAAVLEHHPRIRSSVVVARRNSHEETTLVTYIVPSGKPAMTFAELRSYLGKQFPDYMIPSAFMVLDSLPLTPNGKVDRKALPDPYVERSGSKDSYVAPRTPIEKLLEGIWCDVLGIKKVGIYDNFFELGGHSLLAIKVISRVRWAFEVNLPVRCLFESPTVEGLTDALLQRTGDRKKMGKRTALLMKVAELPEEEVLAMIDDMSEGQEDE
jgi:acyl-CoA synthetase (AMP-forming)/AMP-acid ligase II